MLIGICSVIMIGKQSTMIITNHISVVMVSVLAWSGQTKENKLVFVASLLSK